MALVKVLVKMPLWVEVEEVEDGKNPKQFHDFSFADEEPSVGIQEVLEVLEVLEE